MTKKALAQLHADFNAVLPRIIRHARVMFRAIQCYHTKQDKIQEVCGHCWRWIQELHQLGKAWWTFVSRLADYACRAVRSGRRIAGMISAKDVMNEITQTRKGFYVGKLPDYSTESCNPLAEALSDNTVSEVPDQVAFRLDFPEFRGSHSQRDQRLMDDLMLGHRTKDVARKFRMSEGRISQLRRQFYEGWGRFHSEEVQG